MASRHETAQPRLAGDAQRPVPSCLVPPDAMPRCLDAFFVLSPIGQQNEQIRSADVAITIQVSRAISAFIARAPVGEKYEKVARAN